LFIENDALLLIAFGSILNLFSGALYNLSKCNLSNLMDACELLGRKVYEIGHGRHFEHNKNYCEVKLIDSPREL
jgi:hypothetical protein